MCISLEWSIGAAVIGVTSGLMLYNQGEKAGLFVIYFTSMQIVEAMAHSKKFNPKLISRLGNLSINGQGVAFAVSMVLAKQAHPLIILPFILHCVVSWNLLYDFQVQSGKNNGIRWIKKDYQSVRSQYIMYCTMILLGLLKVPKLTAFFIATLFLTYSTRPKTHAPGLWCFASAIASPMLLLLISYEKSSFDDKK